MLGEWFFLKAQKRDLEIGEIEYIRSLNVSPSTPVVWDLTSETKSLAISIEMYHETRMSGQEVFSKGC